MSDNEIEDVSFLPGGHSGNKKGIYDTSGSQHCRNLVLSQRRAVLIVSIIIGAFFLIAIIAAFARSGTSSCSLQAPVEPTVADHLNGQPTVAIATNGERFPWNNIRLPESIVPLIYELFIWPNLTMFQFHGNASILLDVKSSTDFIVLHSKELTIHSCTVTRIDSPNHLVENIRVIKVLEFIHNEQIYLELESKLKPDTKYQLLIEFNGTLTDSLAGFYRSSYETNAGEKRWLAVTHFEPTDARAAFPCFDEPHLKANFTLSMVRKPDQVALFNTEKVGEREINDGTLIVDIFATSVKMSTYLVAFVLCDFGRKSKFTKTGIQVSVYAPKELLNQTDFALSVATDVLEFYEDFYGVKYPLNKSDHIAIPDFAAGAMENWGLVTYLMRYLLYNPDESSATDQQWVAVVIAHELAHQWFGNLVTMKWWNDLWLNEGFARFVEGIGTDHVRPEYRRTEVFVDDALSTALYSDALASSHPISVPVFDPSEIGEIFDSISYEKGASVIRMLESFLGNQVFIGGLRNYLKQHKYGNAETVDLWRALTEQVTVTGSGMNIQVKDVMDTWTLQMGYPVVTISRHMNIVNATQARFLFNPRANLTEEFTSPYGYKWYIPLTYVTSSEPEKNSPVVWMRKSNVNFQLDNPSDVKWIKVNANWTGVYRVHYDEANWRALINQLREDHTVFSVADRTSLISDAFALARSGHLDVTLALDLSLYLVNEFEYVPWQIALSSLGHIGDLLEDHPDYINFRDFMRYLTRNVIIRLGWNDTGSQLDKLLRSSILSDSIHRGDEDSVVQARRLFSDWFQNNRSVKPNLKSVVYTGGVQYGGDKEWQFVLQRFLRTQTPSEKSKLLTSLASSTDVMTLNRFLQLSLNETVIRSSETPSVLQLIASNPSGRVLAWRFVRSNWKVLYARYHTMMMKMRRIIFGVCGQFSTQFDLDEVKWFFKNNLHGENIRSVSQVLEKIAMNVDWLSRNGAKVFDWLRTNKYQMKP